ncbi:hypothetical protein [uncultured Methanomethylovorans sp.]|uniref:hypothetical protein n=1 Tax=uncultured Methanomethylovorans sp. TaxID=183759 RepID=UPI002AA701BA|nr:hypothetical protein [uncultured Methanomethylovorans sp.]
MRLLFVLLTMIAFSLSVYACSVSPADIVDNSTDEDEHVDITLPVDKNPDISEQPDVVEPPIEEADDEIHRSGGYGEARIIDLVKNETYQEERIVSDSGLIYSKNDTIVAVQNGESNIPTVAITLGGIGLVVGVIRYILMK